MGLVVVLVGGGDLIYQGIEKSKLFEPNFMVVESGELVNTLEVSGVVDAKRRAQMRFLVGGEVTSVPGLEGVSLRKGELVAQLDKAILQKQLEKSLNYYSMQRLVWDQQLDDVKDRAIDQEEQRGVDKNQFLLNNSVLDVEITSLSFDDYRMTAPFDGVIINAPITTPSVVIGPSDIFEIVDPSSLVMKALIDETDLKLVKTGMMATLTFDAYQEEEVSLSSYVSRVGYKNISQDSNAVFVLELPISEADLGKFRIGMNGNAKIVLELRPSVIKVALENVLLDSEGNYYVYVKDKKAKQFLMKKESNGDLIGVEGVSKQIITIGLETDDYYEVASGLMVGDEVVTFF